MFSNIKKDLLQFGILIFIFNCMTEIQSEETRPGTDINKIQQSADKASTKKLGYPYYTGAVIPKPKEAQFENSFIDLADLKAQKNNTCILLGKNPSNQEIAATERLQERLRLVIENGINIINDMEKVPSDDSVVISIGTPESNSLNALLCKKEGLKVTPAYPGTEGYVLFSKTYKGKTVIACCGSDASGSYYAFSSLNQLITVKDGKLLLRKARIIDWPSCLRRTASAFRVTEATFEWMSEYKLNSYFQGYNGAKYWFGLLPEYRKDTLDMCKKAAEKNVIKYEVMINPYAPYHNPGDTNNHKINVSDNNDIQALIANYRMFLEAGARTIMLACDDFVWVDNLEFVLSYPEDKARFKDVAESHIYMANTVYSTLGKDYPDLQMFFCPSYYSEGHVTEWAREPELGRNYLEKIGKGLLPQIKIVLTGPKVVSPAISAEDVIRLQDYLGKRDWYLWDNSASLYYTNRLGAEKPVGFFRPFTSKFPDDFIKSHSSVFYSLISKHILQERVRITHISIADYLWNPEAYDPEWSLRQAIDSYVGPGMADLLIKFGDLFATVDRSIAMVSQTASSSQADKILFQDSFEDNDLEKTWRWNENMDTRQEKTDVKDGEQCVVSGSTRQGCFLRSKKGIALAMDDIKKYSLDFFWKTSNPATALVIRFVSDNGKESYLEKKIKAPNTEWNHYHIPLTDFNLEESAKSPIRKIAEIRFYRDGYKGILKSVTFKIDKVCLSESSGETEKINQRIAAIDDLKNCAKEIESKCWNKTLADDIRRLLEPKVKTTERFYNKPSINIIRTEKPPVIDGRLDDVCWKKAAKTTLFKTGSDSSKEIIETWAMAAHDDDNLYIAFKCKADKWDDDDKLVEGRDSSIGVNDAVEIFIEPVIGSGEYFHLGTNRGTGTIDQQRGTRANGAMLGIPGADGGAKGRKWNPEWTVKASKADDSWIAEIQIPFSSLGKKPAKNDIWGMNFCRSYIPGNEYGAWSCTYGKFHTPLFFGKAVFE